ncbi:hypothetical protein [Cereibacter johrii]|uniref:hypothetical protein n=1 Tax=Cereibacter johrii TaxID=445629 RepID=UPI001F3AA755|nr:hypothetical protein [Cereibacter johrii]
MPILAARLGARSMPLSLKGGQMGEADFFARALARLKAPEVLQRASDLRSVVDSCKGP